MTRGEKVTVALITAAAVVIAAMISAGPTWVSIIAGTGQNNAPERSTPVPHSQTIEGNGNVQIGAGGSGITVNQDGSR